MITIRELAKLAKVGKSTVAYALKDDPRISVKVRENIARLARKQGYRPSPLINTLMHEVRLRKVGTARASLAYLISGRESRVENLPLYEKLLIEGARTEADLLGYSLDVISWEDGNLEPRRVENILRHRGIRGIFLGPALTPRKRIELDWGRFAVVASGYTIEHPLADRLAADLENSVIEAVDMALTRGYSYVGLVVNKEMDERVGHQWIGGLQIQKALQGVGRFWSLSAPGTDIKARLGLQLQRHPGSAVIGDQFVLRQMTEMGVSVPREAGFICLHTPDSKRVTAIIQPDLELGRRAIAHLAHLVERGKWGEPAIPCRSLLKCGWQEGETLPVRKARAQQDGKARRKVTS